MGTGSTVQPYKYGGKELDMMHGLNQYDFAARQKDDWRFTTVDPLAEKFYNISPYAYCANNPMKYVDPTGMAYDYPTAGKDPWMDEYNIESDIQRRAKAKERGDIFNNRVKDISTDYVDRYGKLVAHVDDGSNNIECILPEVRVTGKNPWSEVCQGGVYRRVNSARGISIIIGEMPLEQVNIEFNILLTGRLLLNVAESAAASAAMESTATQNGVQIGQNFDKLGTIVENPGLNITNFSKHGLNQAITRGVNPSTMLNTVKNSISVLQQNGGNYLHLSREAAVVLNPAGKLVSTYPASMFDRSILNIIKGF